jgi:polysaccharide export outer membrane protein
MTRILFTFLFGLSPVVLAQTVSFAPSTWSQPSAIDSSAELLALLSKTEAPITLASYDLISVRVYGAEALSSKCRIGTDGVVNIPLIGSIAVAGRTVAEAQNDIASLLESRNLVLSPSVVIELLETPGRVITVYGEVNRPGVYPAYGDSQLAPTGSVPASGVHTLAQLVGYAGGLKDSAASTLTLIRPSLRGPISIPLGPDPNHQPYGSLPLFPGDEIIVANLGQAYVIGAVKKQGRIPLKNFSPTTVGEAVAMSDGVGFEASADSSLLVRTEGAKRVVIKVPVRKIIEGKVADIALQNDDILYSPTNGGKAALKSGAAGLIVSLASTYIYAHP